MTEKLLLITLIGCFNLIAIWALYSFIRRRLYEIEADTTNCYQMIMHFEKHGIFDRDKIFEQMQLIEKQKEQEKVKIKQRLIDRHLKYKQENNL